MRSASDDMSSSAVESNMFPELRNRQPDHEWTLHDGTHWQVTSPSFEDPALTDTEEGNRGACPGGMVEVRGRMRRDRSPYSLESMQSIMCSDWLSRSFPERCGVFDQGKWEAFLVGVPTDDEAFCIDRFEYPNVKGQYPWILVTWIEATRICDEEGKRLCTEGEWTFACEGEDAWPYPYGFVRSSATCVIDRAWRNYDERAWADRSSRFAMLARQAVAGRSVGCAHQLSQSVRRLRHDGQRGRVDAVDREPRVPLDLERRILGRGARPLSIFDARPRRDVRVLSTGVPLLRGHPLAAHLQGEREGGTAFDRALMTEVTGPAKETQVVHTERGRFCREEKSHG